MNFLSNKYIFLTIITLACLFVINLAFLEFIPSTHFTDNGLLYSTSLLTFFLILFSLKIKSTFSYYNLILFLFYTFIFYYSLFVKNTQGMTLIFWSCCLLITSVHFVLLLLVLVIRHWDFIFQNKLNN
jgi:hypothetical protein